MMNEKITAGGNEFIFGIQLGQGDSKVYAGTNNETQELVAIKHVHQIGNIGKQKRIRTFSIRFGMSYT